MTEKLKPVCLLDKLKFKGFYKESSMQIHWPPCSSSESAETASDTNSSRLSICRETEGLENTSGSSAVGQRGVIKGSYGKEE